MRNSLIGQDGWRRASAFVLRGIPAGCALAGSLGLLLTLLWPTPGLSVRTGSLPFTVSAMLRMAAPQDLALSRDGRFVAFTVVGQHEEADGEETDSRIYLAERDGGVARPVTPLRDQCEKPQLSSDGSRLAYLVDSDDGADVVVMRLPSGRTRRLTREKTDVIDLAFAPNGRTLAATVSRPLPCFRCPAPAAGVDVEVVGNGLDSAAGLYLFSVDQPGSVRPLITNSDVGDFAFSPDGSRIAFECSPLQPLTEPHRAGAPHGGGNGVRDASQSDIAVVDVRTGVVTRLTDTPAAETTPRFSPDGKWLAYVSTAAPGFYFNAGRVMVVPAAGGKARALAATPDTRPELLGWSSRDDAVIVREPKGTSAVLWELPLDGSPARLLSQTPHMVSQACLAASGAVLAMVLEDSDLPPEVWLSSARHFSLRPVSDVNKAFADYRLANTRVVRWLAQDGTPLEGLYTAPVAATNGPPPLLVVLHGGPAVAADRQCLGSLNYYPLAVFAERGYAVFRPNVRGSDGYGSAFRMANRGDWGGGDYGDLLAGIAALVDRKLADPNRLGIMGWSYGGYLTAWAISHGRQFKAASIGAGITDLVSQSGSMDLTDFIPLYFGGETARNAERLLAHSPVRYADAIVTPTLLQHGVEDERVPFTQSLELFTALSRRGVPTCLAAYPRSGHDVTEPALLRDLMTRNLNWFARYLPVGAQ